MKEKVIKRLNLWFMLILMGILLDEYVKEGYIIKLSDFLKFPTHESLLLLVTLSYALLRCWLWLKRT